MPIIASYVATAVAIAGSLPAFYVSIKRLLSERTLLDLLLTLLSAFITATFVSALCRSAQIYNEYIAPQHPDTLFVYGLYGCMAVVTLVVDIVLFLFVKWVTHSNLYKWIIGLIVLFLVCCVIASIGISILGAMPLGTALFATFCAVMGVSGIAWGLDYKEICVIGNIYLEAAFCLLSAFCVVWEAVRRHRVKRTSGSALLIGLTSLYSLFYVVLFVLICRHYAMPLSDAFDLCYNELQHLSGITGFSYDIVNYLIFIIGFTIPTGINLIAASIINPKSSSSLFTRGKTSLQ